jgi:flagellar basal body-associated protein FliL
MRKGAILLAAVMFTASCASAIAAGGGGGKPKSKSPAKRQITTLAGWVDVDPFTVSIVQRQVVTGTLMVTFGIDVPDEGLRAKAEGILPRLRNNWLLAIHQYAATNLRPRVQPDIDGLANRLQRVTDETLGKPGAKVLLSNVIAMVK